jgi:hypothetical protein
MTTQLKQLIGLTLIVISSVSFAYPLVCPSRDQVVFLDSPAPGETNLKATSTYVIDKDHNYYENWVGGAFGISNMDNAKDPQLNDTSTPATCTYFENGQAVAGLEPA